MIDEKGIGDVATPGIFTIGPPRSIDTAFSLIAKGSTKRVGPHEVNVIPAMIRQNKICLFNSD